jgi:hypothetical protein
VVEDAPSGEGSEWPSTFKSRRATQATGIWLVDRSPESAFAETRLVCGVRYVSKVRAMMEAVRICKWAVHRLGEMLAAWNFTLSRAVSASSYPKFGKRQNLARLG